ncbi:MAG: hypothetical protein M1826_006922 [Phylliscum demangeonii]|nr:MAG: hypothetical protein M1826_006922 [Phylliscum demangeonii]
MEASLIDWTLDPNDMSQCTSPPLRIHPSGYGGEDALKSPTPLAPFSSPPLSARPARAKNPYMSEDLSGFPSLWKSPAEDSFFSDGPASPASAAESSSSGDYSDTSSLPPLPGEPRRRKKGLAARGLDYLRQSRRRKDSAAKRPHSEDSLHSPSPRPSDGAVPKGVRNRRVPPTKHEEKKMRTDREVVPPVGVFVDERVAQEALLHEDSEVMEFEDEPAMSSTTEGTRDSDDGPSDFTENIVKYLTAPLETLKAQRKQRKELKKKQKALKELALSPVVRYRPVFADKKASIEVDAGAVELSGDGNHGTAGQETEEAGDEERKTQDEETGSANVQEPAVVEVDEDVEVEQGAGSEAAKPAEAQDDEEKRLLKLKTSCLQDQVIHLRDAVDHCRRQMELLTAEADDRLQDFLAEKAAEMAAKDAQIGLLKEYAQHVGQQKDAPTMEDGQQRRHEQLAREVHVAALTEENQRLRDEAGPFPRAREDGLREYHQLVLAKDALIVKLQDRADDKDELVAMQRSELAGLRAELERGQQMRIEAAAAEDGHAQARDRHANEQEARIRALEQENGTLRKQCEAGGSGPQHDLQAQEKDAQIAALTKANERLQHEAVRATVLHAADERKHLPELLARETEFARLRAEVGTLHAAATEAEEEHRRALSAADERHHQDLAAKESELAAVQRAHKQLQFAASKALEEHRIRAGRQDEKHDEMRQAMEAQGLAMTEELARLRQRSEQAQREQDARAQAMEEHVMTLVEHYERLTTTTEPAQTQPDPAAAAGQTAMDDEAQRKDVRIAALGDEVDRLRTQVEAAEVAGSRARSAEQARDRDAARLATMDDEAQRKDARIAALGDEVDRLRTQVEAAEAARSRARSADQARGRDAARLAAMDDEAQRKDARIAALGDEVDRLRTQVEAAEAAGSRARSADQARGREADGEPHPRHRSHRSSPSSQQGGGSELHLQKQVDQLGHTNRVLEEEISRFADQAAQQAAQAQEAKRAAAQTKREQEKQQRALASLQRTIDRLQRELEPLREEKERLADDVRVLRAQEEHAVLEEERSRFADQAAQQAAQAHEAKRAAAQSKREQEKQQQRALASLQRTIDRQQQELGPLRQENERLAHDVRVLRAQEEHAGRVGAEQQRERDLMAKVLLTQWGKEEVGSGGSSSPPSHHHHPRHRSSLLKADGKRKSTSGATTGATAIKDRGATAAMAQGYRYQYHVKA